MTTPPPDREPPASLNDPRNQAQPQLSELRLAPHRVEETELRLPRPPGVFRRWLAAHPRLLDGAIVAAYLLGCALMMLLDALSGYAAEAYSDITTGAAETMTSRASYLSSPMLLVGLVTIVIVALALAFRRRFPLAGLIVVTLLLWLDLGALGFANSVALVFLLYAVPVYRSQRAGWSAYGLTVASHVLYLFVSYLTSREGSVTGANVLVPTGPTGLAETIGMSVMTALWLLAVLMIGINLGNRKRYVAALIDRAHQLAREREQRAELAAAAERARIAREMHDIVAHSLSVVVTLGEAASVAIDSQPEAAKQAMTRAAETGRSALTEMRRLLGVLNEEPAAGTPPEALRAPQPGLGELPTLIAGFEDAGLRITVTEQGVPAGDAAQRLAVFRIVQESLTNALRYAGAGSSVELKFLHSPRATRIEALDSGPTGVETGARATIPGTGRGLAGAEQRARVFGGTLVAGPFGRGWRVLAEVPVEAAAATDTSTGEPQMGDGPK